MEKIPWFIWLLADGVVFFLSKETGRRDGIIFILLSQGTNLLLHIIGAVMAFFVLQKVSNIIKWKKSKMFMYFSCHSMPIYLFHQQIIYFFIYYFNGKLHPYINTLINFIGAMLISIIMSDVLMRFKITRFFIGEK